MFIIRVVGKSKARDAQITRLHIIEGRLQIVGSNHHAVEVVHLKGHLSVRATKPSSADDVIGVELLQNLVHTVVCEGHTCLIHF